MLSSEDERLIKTTDEVGCATKTVNLTLQHDFSIADVRFVQKFLHQILEARSRLNHE